MSQLLEPKFLVNAITQAVATFKHKSREKPTGSNSGSRDARKPYSGKLHTPQLVSGMNGSLDLELNCQYCKDRGVKINWQLALEKGNRKESGQ